MPTDPGDPVLAITYPESGATVPTDFSIRGSYAGWNGSGGQITCEIKLEGDAKYPPLPLQVVATTQADPINCNDGTWEACFKGVAAGTYSVTPAFNGSYKPIYLFTITVA